MPKEKKKQDNRSNRLPQVTWRGPRVVEYRNPVYPGLLYLPMAAVQVWVHDEDDRPHCCIQRSRGGGQSRGWAAAPRGVGESGQPAAERLSTSAEGKSDGMVWLHHSPTLTCSFQGRRRGPHGAPPPRAGLLHRLDLISRCRLHGHISVATEVVVLVVVAPWTGHGTGEEGDDWGTAGRCCCSTGSSRRR